MEIKTFTVADFEGSPVIREFLACKHLADNETQSVVIQSQSPRR